MDFNGDEFKALEYEFMANGSLGKWLHQVGVEDQGRPEEPRNLKLIQKLDISMDIASALEYLHCGCELAIGKVIIYIHIHTYVHTLHDRIMSTQTTIEKTMAFYKIVGSYIFLSIVFIQIMCHFLKLHMCASTSSLLRSEILSLFSLMWACLISV